GDAVEDGVARQRVEEAAVEELVDVDPEVRGGVAQPGAGPVVSPAVRQAHHAPADLRGDLGGRGHLSPGALDPHRLAVEHAEAFGVLRVDVQGAAVGAAGEGGHVVHPAVVGPQVAAADQDESGGAFGEGGVQPGQVVGDRP